VILNFAITYYQVSWHTAAAAAAAALLTPLKNCVFCFQGRYGKGNGQEYLEHFMIEYRRTGT
jgi:hypothetical protein